MNKIIKKLVVFFATVVGIVSLASCDNNDSEDDIDYSSLTQEDVFSISSYTSSNSNTFCAGITWANLTATSKTNAYHYSEDDKYTKNGILKNTAFTITPQYDVTITNISFDVEIEEAPDSILVCFYKKGTYFNEGYIYSDTNNTEAKTQFSLSYQLTQAVKKGSDYYFEVFASDVSVINNTNLVHYVYNFKITYSFE